MAKISEVVAKQITEAIKSTATGFVGGAKHAFVSQLPPAVLAAGSYLSDIRKKTKEKDKKDNKDSEIEQEQNQEQIEQQKKTNNYLGDSIVWLQTLSADMTAMKNTSSKMSNSSEESVYEKGLYDEKVLSTLEEIRDTMKSIAEPGSTKDGGTGESGGGFLKSLLRGLIVGKLLGRKGGVGGAAAGAGGAAAAGGAGIDDVLGVAAIAGGASSIFGKIFNKQTLTFMMNGMKTVLPRLFSILLNPAIGIPLTILSIASLFSGKANAATNQNLPKTPTKTDTGDKKPAGAPPKTPTKPSSQLDGLENLGRDGGPVGTQLADIIAKGESGAQGYNAYNKLDKNGKAKAGLTGPPMNLEAMTVKEVMNLQSQKKIFAAGRYQVIPETLQRAVAKMGIDPASTKFDSKFQDQLFQFLIPQTTKSFLAGDKTVTKEEAQIDLAKVWAAVPMPGTGKSYYEGKAGNKATISQAEIDAVLSSRTSQPVTPVLPTAQLDANKQQRANAAAERERTQNEKVSLLEKRKDLRSSMEAIDGAIVKYTIAQTEAEKSGNTEKAAEFKRIVDDLKDARKQKDAEFKAVSIAYKEADTAAAVASATEQTTGVRTTRSDDEQRRDPNVTAELARRERAMEAASAKSRAKTKFLDFKEMARQSRANLGLRDRRFVDVRKSDPYEVARLEAEKASKQAGPTSQDVLEAIKLEEARQLGETSTEGKGTIVPKGGKTNLERLVESNEDIAYHTRELNRFAEQAAAGGFRSISGVPVARGRTLSTRRELSPEEKRNQYFENRYQGLITSAGNITKNLISKELNNLFFPKGRPQTGVSRAQGEKNGFLAGVAGRELQLGKKATNLLTDLFGKKIGRAYGGVTGQALGLGIEKFAGDVGRGLGFGEEKTGLFGNTFQSFNMGQILGNFAGNKGQRKLAREQLIFNLTGVPTGSTTLLNTVDKFFPDLGLVGKDGKISFNKIAEAGGSFVTEGLSSLFGIPQKGKPGGQTGPGFFDKLFGRTPVTPATVTKISEETGLPYQALAEPGDTTTTTTAAAPQQSFFGSIIDGIFGKKQPAGVTVPNAPRPISERDQSAFLEANNVVPEELKTTNEALADQSTNKDDKGFFGGMMDSISGLGTSLMSIFTGAGGGTGGGMGGGFGGGGGGGFFDNLMNMGGNLLTSYLTYKIAGGLTKNIKDPKKKMIADVVIGEGIKYGIKQFAIPAIQSAISGTAAAEALVAASPWLAGKLGITGAQIGATTSAPINAALIESAAASGAGGTGAAAAAGAGAAAAAAGAPALAAAPLSTVLAAPAAELGVISGLSEAAIGANLSAGATGGTAAGASTMLAEMGAFLANPVVIATLFVLAGVAMMSKGGTPHYSGFSKTKGSGFDRSWHADDKHISAEYTRVTDPLAMSAKSILDKHAANVGSTDKFEVAIAIGSDNEDPSYSIYQIYKNGTTVYDSGQEWGLPISFPDAVKTFVDKRLNGPLVEAMRSVSMTDAQKTALGNVSEYTTAGQISDFVQKGSTDASLLTPTYAGVTAENAGFEDITFGGGGESGNDITTVTPMVYSLKDKAFVPIKETVSATGTSTDDVGREQQYTYQTADKTVLGYDENGNPIRAADLNRKVGTATAASTVTGNATGSQAASNAAVSMTSTAVPTGSSVSAANTAVDGAVVGTPRGTATPSSGTVTGVYNAMQQESNQISGFGAGAGGGSTTANVNSTNVVDNSVVSSTTIVNTNTRNSDPVLFGSRYGRVNFSSSLD